MSYVVSPSVPADSTTADPQNGGPRPDQVQVILQAMRSKLEDAGNAAERVTSRIKAWLAQMPPCPACLASERLDLGDDREIADAIFMLTELADDLFDRMRNGDIFIPVSDAAELGPNHDTGEFADALRALKKPELLPLLRFWVWLTEHPFEDSSFIKDVDTLAGTRQIDS